MRLICGIWMRDGQPVDRARLVSMCAAMQPDARFREAEPEFWCEGEVGFGVLGFSADSPRAVVRSPRGTWIAGDLQLHEPEELRASLGAGPESEAELVASAFDRYAVDAPMHLLGDFALAAWQGGARELWLARDAAGVRPCVYHDAPGRHFLFASFARGLHASGLCPRELNAGALVGSLLGQFHAEETLSAGVLQVPPGSVLKVSARGVERRTYWRPASQPQRHKEPEEAAEELRSLLDRAVRGRLRGTGPVAAHLSGGLDSSTLTVLAARALRSEGRPLLGYSFLPAEEGGEDERPFVQSVLRQEPDIRWKAISPPPILEVLQSARDVDRAFPLAAGWPDNAVCFDAAAHGADRLISGWGGDEGATYNGRGVLAHAFLRGRWRYLAAELEALKRERGFRRRNTLLGDVASPMLPSGWFDALQKPRGHDGSEGWKPSALLARGPRGREREIASGAIAIGPNARRNQLTLLRSAHIASRTTDWAAIGARAGLSVSFPLLDRRVLEWALAVPPHWHLRGGWKRRLLRDATEGILPDTIRWRHGKLAPYPDTVWQFAEQRERILRRARELQTNAAIRSLFDLGAVEKAIEALPSPDALRSGQGRSTLGSEVATLDFVLGYIGYVEQYA